MAALLFRRREVTYWFTVDHPRLLDLPLEKIHYCDKISLFHYFIPDRSTNDGIHFENHDPVVNKYLETHRSRVQLAKLSKKRTDPGYKAEWNRKNHELNHYKCPWRRAKILVQRKTFYLFKLLLSLRNATNSKNEDILLSNVYFELN